MHDIHTFHLLSRPTTPCLSCVIPAYNEGANLGSLVPEVLKSLQVLGGRVAPLLLETFVECGRHKGTCYKAANWINVGRTARRGKKSTSHKPLIAAKDIWLYPLRKNPAAALCS
jgi:hypothetical protein